MNSRHKNRFIYISLDLGLKTLKKHYKDTKGELDLVYCEQLLTYLLREIKQKRLESGE